MSKNKVGWPLARTIMVFTLYVSAKVSVAATSRSRSRLGLGLKGLVPIPDSQALKTRIQSSKHTGAKPSTIAHKFLEHFSNTCLSADEYHSKSLYTINFQGQEKITLESLLPLIIRSTLNLLINSRDKSLAYLRYFILCGLVIVFQSCASPPTHVDFREFGRLRLTTSDCSCV